MCFYVAEILRTDRPGLCTFNSYFYKTWLPLAFVNTLAVTLDAFSLLTYVHRMYIITHIDVLGIRLFYI